MTVGAVSPHYSVRRLSTTPEQIHAFCCGVSGVKQIDSCGQDREEPEEPFLWQYVREHEQRLLKNWHTQTFQNLISVRPMTEGHNENFVGRRFGELQSQSGVVSVA